MNNFDDSKSVWHSFTTERHMNVMSAGQRKCHPSRYDFYSFFDAVSDVRNRKLVWLDLGTVSMVDYNFLAKEQKFDFDFVGVDMSKAIIDDSRTRLHKETDNIYLWNIENSDIPSELFAKKYDIISARHILNHCTYYEQPLLNLRKLLADDGFIYINLHLECVDGSVDILKTHNEWSMDGDVIGNWYSASKLQNFLAENFTLLEWKLISNNTIIIIEKKK